MLFGLKPVRLGPTSVKTTRAVVTPIPSIAVRSLPYFRYSTSRISCPCILSLPAGRPFRPKSGMNHCKSLKQDSSAGLLRALRNFTNGSAANLGTKLLYGHAGTIEKPVIARRNNHRLCAGAQPNESFFHGQPALSGAKAPVQQSLKSCQNSGSSVRTYLTNSSPGAFGINPRANASFRKRRIDSRPFSP